MFRRELLRLGVGTLAVGTAGCLEWIPSDAFSRGSTPTPAPSPEIPEPPVHWRREYQELDAIGAILPATDGHLLVGTAYIGTDSLASLVVLRVDSEGRERWRRTYSTLGWRYTGVPLTEGGWMFVGCPELPDGRDRDMHAFALTGRGEERWRRSFAAAGGALLTATPGLDDTAVFGGYRSPSGHSRQPWAVCLDTDGVLRWEYTTNKQGEFVGVAPTADGYVFVRAKREESDDANVVKLDGEGQEVWSRDYTEVDRLYGIRATGEGYVLFGGVSLGSHAPSRLALLAVDPSGDPQWGYRYDPSDSESFVPLQATDLLVTSDGGFVFGGNYFVRGVPYGPDYRPALLGVAPGGDQVQWLAAYGGGTSGGAGAVVATSEGYLYGGWMTEDGHNTAVLTSIPAPLTSNVDSFSAVPLASE